MSKLVETIKSVIKYISNVDFKAKFKKVISNIVSFFVTFGVKKTVFASFSLFLMITLVISSVSTNGFKGYTIIDGDNKYSVYSKSNNVGDILLSADISVNDEDIVSLSNDGVITIDRTYSKTITPDLLFSASQITDNVISYTDDVVSGASQASVPMLIESDGSANLQPLSVGYTYKTVTKSVKYSHKTVYSNKLERGKTSVTKGKNGEKTIVYKQLVVGGIVVSTEKESEKITKQPVAEVETIGTKYNYSSAGAVQTNEDVACISVLKPSKPIELDENGIPINYVDKISGKGSAYSDGNATSTGVKPRPGYVAVNPKQIPYGTKMYIVSADGKYIYGYAIAADTGGFAYNGSGRIVDLRFNTETECRRFGVRQVNIYILPDWLNNLYFKSRVVYNTAFLLYVGE